MNLKTTIRRDGVKVHYLPSSMNLEDPKKVLLIEAVENFLRLCVKKVRKVKRQIKL